MNLLEIAFLAFITENIFLYRFMGVSSIIKSTEKKSSSILVGIILLLMMISTSIISMVLYRYVLVPLHLEYFCIFSSIIIIILMTYLIQFIVRKVSPNYSEDVEKNIQVATINSSVFGTSYIIIHSSYNMGEAFVFALFSGLGFFLVGIVFAKLREKIDNSPVPKSFSGVPITLITAAALAIIFARLSGII